MNQADRQTYFKFFFFAVFILLLYQLLKLLSPFFIPVLGATVLTLMFFPLQEWSRKRFRPYPSAAAAVSTAIVAILAVLPLLLFGWVFLKEAARVYPSAAAWVENVSAWQTDPSVSGLPESLVVLWGRADRWLSYWNIDLKEIVLNNLDQLRSTVTYLTVNIIKNTLFVLFDILVLVFTLFFFFRDGPAIVGHLVDLVPMAKDHKRHILERLMDTLYGVIRGLLATAAAQGVLTGLGFAFAGVRFPVLLGFATFFLAPIPFIGIGGVWVPVAAYLFLAGLKGPAIFVAVWSLLVVGLIDNFLRPYLIGTHAKIPILLLFFALLGGLKAFGFAGLLIGPMLVALILAFIKIYQEEYRWHEINPEA